MFLFITYWSVFRRTFCTFDIKAEIIKVLNKIIFLKSKKNTSVASWSKKNITGEESFVYFTNGISNSVCIKV